MREYVAPPVTTMPRTTPPPVTASRNGPNADSANVTLTSAIGMPGRRSGLSDPYTRIASSYGTRANGVSTLCPAASNIAWIAPSTTP